MKLDDWLDTLNLELELRRYPNQDGRWIAKVSNLEIVVREILLTSNYGNGKSPAGAISQYVANIRGQKAVINAYKSSRREFMVPNHLEP